MAEHMMQAGMLQAGRKTDDEYNAAAAADRDALIQRVQAGPAGLDTGILDVMDFNRVFGLNDQTFPWPSMRSQKITGFRVAMLLEELAELSAACRKEDITDALDALCDLQYFLDGTFIALGLQHVKREAMTEVHRSNMLKVWPDGRVHRDAAGKVIKPDGWKAPDLQSIIDRTLDGVEV